MTAELQLDDGADAPHHRERPNVSGDLPGVLGAAPMFRRSVAGYDRFQVDTYVQWAEDELATADRERERLLARHLRTRAALDDAQQLLAHSAGGGEFLQVSRHIGSLLAAAADEAEGMRAEAAADRTAAAEQAARTVAEAQRVLADAAAEAGRTIAEANGEAAGRLAEAVRIVGEADGARSTARAEVEARLEEVRLTERRAAEQAERIRRRAEDDGVAARLQARDDIVRMLTTAREQRRRADAEAAATRERMDRESAARRASLLAEIDDLQLRVAVQRAELASMRPATRSSGSPLARLGGHLDGMRVRLEQHLAPWRSARGRRRWSG